MNSDYIVLFIVIALLVILAGFLYLLFRRSVEKKHLEEQKKIGLPEMINITPEFKFDAQYLNNPDIPSINDVKKSIMNSLSSEIVIDEPKIIESHENETTITEQKSAVKEAPELRLEDTLIGEDEAAGKRIRKKKGKKRKKQKKKTGIKTNPVISEGTNAV